jgi:site-specific recombinase XerD
MNLGPPTQKRANALKQTKQHFDVYLQFLEDLIAVEDLSEKSAKQYVSKIIQLLEYFDDDDFFEDIKINDIIAYAEDEGKTINVTFKAALRYLISSTEKNNSFSITAEEVDDLSTKQKTKTREASPLSIEEIIAIRNDLQAKDKHLNTFIFEMFFTYGIKLKEFRSLKKVQFSLEELTFTSKESKTKILSREIVHLLKIYDDLPSNKVSAVQRKINFIGEILKPKRDKLIWGDIIATRAKNFPTCPKCEENYPNTDEYWALIEYESDSYQKKWLFCRRCAEKEYKKGEKR